MKTAHDILAEALTPQALAATIGPAWALAFDGGDGVTVDAEAAEDLWHLLELKRLVDDGILSRSFEKKEFGHG